MRSDNIPLVELQHAHKHTAPHGDAVDDETNRHLCVPINPIVLDSCHLFLFRELLVAINDEAATVEDPNNARDECKAIKADFIRDHPTYDKTFWLLPQKSRVRRDSASCSFVRQVGSASTDSAPRRSPTPSFSSSCSLPSSGRSLSSRSLHPSIAGTTMCRMGACTPHYQDRQLQVT